MRLIDADAVLEELKRMEVELMPAKLAHIYTAVVVEDAPTIDAVPVVRCKDCKWYGRVDKRRFYRGMDCLQKHIDTIVPDRDFCSKAERKGEQDE